MIANLFGRNRSSKMFPKNLPIIRFSAIFMVFVSSAYGVLRASATAKRGKIKDFLKFSKQKFKFTHFPQF